ncbi:hypothetical protein [Liquorilactobacillus aquaticus]|uniref:hypothetical protein n=1 Tax=Liquorilactobacillus aquaticus TaxID=392566 RepID=UPI00070B494D|nr:hypothetical protein [Liquorilactobacillus aquaticus]
MTIIKILTLLLAGIIFFLGYYLWAHRQKAFLIFHPEKNHALSTIVKIYSLILIISSLITLFAGFFFAPWILALTLICNVTIIATLPIMMLIFLQ